MRKLIGRVLLWLASLLGQKSFTEEEQRKLAAWKERSK